MKKLITGVLLLTAACAAAQDAKPQLFTFGGYLETYYNYDFNQPYNNTAPSFLYNFNRINEVNLNLGYLKASYNSDMVRSNLTLGVGTYMNANYTEVPGALKNIYEADIGVKLSTKNNFWLDAGILPSHIGWETATGMDDPTLSRSMAADNSPYYEAGARLSYTTANGHWYLSAMLLNGWQRIERADGNTTPAFGTQITFTPSSKITLNSSTFIGNDKPDSVRKMRYFHDLYGIFQLSERWSATAGFDIGIEQKAKGSSDFNTWSTAALILRYAITAKTAIALRVEYYDDKNQVIVVTDTPNGFNTWGCSAGIDYNVLKNLLWRIELRSLNSQDDVFVDNNNKTVAQDVELTTSLAFRF
jgi:hypothetical protein